MGASGSVTVWHALGMSTSSIALRLIFLRLDLEPRVATSLLPSVLVALYLLMGVLTIWSRLRTF